jgi:haloacetate dehalogenase
VTEPLFPGSREQDIDVGDGVTIRTRTLGSGPPLLLLHGHPQTHAIWHRVAPLLSKSFSLVLADLRGYGDSSKPPGDDRHELYSKRVMARDVVRVMDALGHAQFAVLAHDRGARVAHRLALDHPSRVTKMVLLDIAPTLAMYEQTGDLFARLYWHWFFLIQPSPTPERLIQADPSAYVHELMGRRHAGLGPFDSRAMHEYIRCLSMSGAAHALCEDYRAAASIDLDHDRKSLAEGQKVTCPLKVLWGEQGAVHRCFDPLAEWRKVASNVSGHTLPCGHYIAEEAPDVLLDAVLPFLKKITPDGEPECHQECC